MQSSMLRHITEDFGNGGTIDGDLTISGDLTVSGGGSLSFDEIIEGTSQIKVDNDVAFLVEKDDGTDVFVVDTNNQKIGINTSSPDFALHVHGASDGAGYVKISDANTGEGATDGARIGFNSGVMRIQNFENSDMEFYVNNSTKPLTLESDGSITVSANPTSGTQFTHGSSSFFVTPDGYNCIVRLDKSATNRGARFEYSTVNSTKWYSGLSDSDHFGSGGDEYFISEDFTTPRFIIESGGNVGIGGLPTSILHIHDSVDGDSIVKFDNVAGGSSSTNETMALHLNLGDGSTIRGGAKITAKKELDYSTGANMDASLMFSVLQNNAYNNALFLTSAGNLGLGISEPYNLLHIRKSAVSGSDSHDDDLLVIEENGDHCNINMISDTGSYLMWSDATRNVANINYQHSSGVMGLTAETSFEFNGGNVAVNNAHLNLDSGYELQWNTALTKITGGDTYLVFDVNNSERMRIDSSGNVGIGVSPSYLLHVEDQVDGNYVAYFKNTDSDNGYGVAIDAGDDANVNALQVRTVSGSNLFVVNGAGNATFGGTITATSASDNVAKFESSDAIARIVIEDNASENNGNWIAVQNDVMSFATNGSNTALTLGSNQYANFAGWIQVNDYNTLFSSTSQGAILQAPATTEKIFFRDLNGNVGMTYDAGNQKVGIGLENPSKPLHIYSSDNAPLRVQSTDAYSGIEFRDNTSSSNPPLISALADDFIIYGGSSGTRPTILTLTSSSQLATFSGDVNISKAGNATLNIKNSSDGLSDEGEIGTIEFEGNDGSANRAGVMAKIVARYSDTGSGDAIDGSANEGGSLGFYTSIATTVGGSQTLAEKMRIENNGNVAIGHSSPEAPLDVLGTTGNYLDILIGGNRLNNTTKRWGIASKHYVNAEEPFGFLSGVSNSTDNELYIGGNPNSSVTNDATSIEFYTASNYTTTSATLAMTIDSNQVVELNNGQLKFPASQNASSDANTLDDYEEGTYTATITPSTSGTIPVDSSFDQLSYVKIGSQVTVNGLINAGTVSSPVGFFTISLPFAVVDKDELSGRFSGNVTIYNGSGLNISDYVVVGIEGESGFRVYAGDSASLVSDSANSIVSGTSITISVTYFTS